MSYVTQKEQAFREGYSKGLAEGVLQATRILKEMGMLKEPSEDEEKRPGRERSEG